jgi:hypothetical protein
MYWRDNNMTRVVVRIEGANETIRNLSAFDMRKKQEAMKIVRKHASGVRRIAKQTVPVSPSGRKKSAGSPGDLKRSIRAKYYFQGLGAMVLPAKPKGSHRHLVEYGTGERRTSTGANRGRNTANPFMEPAKRSQETSYNAAMEHLFEDGDTIV